MSDGKRKAVFIPCGDAWEKMSEYMGGEKTEDVCDAGSQKTCEVCGRNLRNEESDGKTRPVCAQCGRLQ